MIYVVPWKSVCSILELLTSISIVNVGDCKLFCGGNSLYSLEKNSSSSKREGHSCVKKQPVVLSQRLANTSKRQAPGFGDFHNSTEAMLGESVKPT